ncbi:mRNA-decapping enzyme 2 [Pyrenophora tritici-repentis]|nr:mRNA-decapping enzyme 2 [Pyrenophora tritici-repentis]
MSYSNRSLVDWLDDLCVRFIVNLPQEELQSVERICFQIEEAQWFYEDFIRPIDPNNLPSMHLRKFSQLMFQHCPLFSEYSAELHQQAYEQFLAYKTRVPVRGAIMLNEEMTHAVLVKGWKKGAKWSFPRGKINKEEADLDCAVREVWEETGYDLRQANLVEPDEHMKKITVTMREQSMMLYVFRGVPMNTEFEPQTRKEISKIDWYKLTDLPMLRRKNQAQQQYQGNGQDLIKESSFYMVAPFLGPLKQWIKQQNKLGRQRARNSANMAPAPVVATDDEDFQQGIYEASANEAEPVADTQPTDNFAEMVARLGRGQPPSNNLPELSEDRREQPQQSEDPAEALKRLLSVGVQTPPVEAPSHPAPGPPQPNSLLALFKQGNTEPGAQQPRTPFDQMMPPPMQPSSPHGQHHPRPPQMGNMGPPPPFFSPQGPPGHFNGMPHPQMPHQYMQPPQHPGHMFSSQPPNMQQVFDQHNPRPFQEMADSQFTAGRGRPEIPHASNLPAPNLNQHAMGLLNSFKTNTQQPAVAQSPHPSIAAPLHRSLQTTPKIEHPLPQHRPHGLVSPQGQFAPSPPQYQSPPVGPSFVPEQPKPRNLHQDSLLSLFRATPPLASPEVAPAELSALPKTPGYPSAHPTANSSKPPNNALLGTSATMPTRTKITSATVSGPVNAPDFETMKKNKQPTSGSSRGPSPATNMPFMPQQILKRAPQASPQSMVKVPPPSQQAVEVLGSPQAAFKPQILKRPQQQQNKAHVPPNGKNMIDHAPATKPTPHAQGLLDMFKGPSPQPPPAQLAMAPSRSPVPPASSMDRRDSVPSDQKNALLSLFGSKPSPSPQPQMHSPIPPARSPFPPTPKKTMSGVVSPVSPLPANGSAGATSPEGMANRSRISSIGDGSGMPSIVIPKAPTSHPADSRVNVGQDNGVSLVGLGSQSKTASATEGKSPVDKSFLLGFLEDVARRGR